MKHEVLKCERCKTPLNGEPDLSDSLVGLHVGDTDIFICYRCAVEMTYIIGAWLNTKPLDAPLKWFLSISP